MWSAAISTSPKAAMLVNVFVAIPAACVTTKAVGCGRPGAVVRSHHRALHFVRGVATTSLRIPNSWGWSWGVQLAEVVNTLVKVIRPPNDHGQETTDQVRFPRWPRWASTGVAAGLLGIGGGVVSVPLMTTFASATAFGHRHHLSRHDSFAL